MVILPSLPTEYIYLPEAEVLNICTAKPVGSTTNFSLVSPSIIATFPASRIITPK